MNKVSNTKLHRRSWLLTAVTAEIRCTTEVAAAVNARNRLIGVNGLMHAQVLQLSKRPVAPVAGVRPSTVRVGPRVSHQCNNGAKPSTTDRAHEPSRTVDATNMRRHVMFAAETAAARRARVEHRCAVCSLVAAKVRPHRKVSAARFAHVWLP